MLNRFIILVFMILCSPLSHSQQAWQPLLHNDTIEPTSILPISYDTIIIGVHTYGEYPHGGVYRSIDGGGSWQFYEIEYGTWRVYDLMLDEDDVIFAGTNRGIYKSADWGESWEKLVTTPSNCISLEKISPSTIFAGCWEYLLRSTNDGLSWDTCLVLNQNTSINSILAVSDSLLYMAATSYTSNEGGLYASYDGGDNWTRIGLVMYNIESLEFSPFDELYAGCWYLGLQKSTDFGISWETVLPNLDAISVISRGNEVFVGSEPQSYVTSGIFYSGDNGVTWENRTHNITNDHIREIAFSNDDYLFSLSLYTTSSLGPPLNRSMNPVVGFDEYSHRKYVTNIYPNPFTSSTTIEYELTEPSHVHLTIYNAIGELVYQIEDYLELGIHTVTWSPGHLPGGMYYAVLRSEEGVYVVKMVKQ